MDSLTYLMIGACYATGCYLAYRAGCNKAEAFAAGALREVVRRLTIMTGRSETEIVAALHRAGRAPSHMRVAK